MNITIKTELDGVKLTGDYRNMTAALIVETLDSLVIQGHRILRVIDLDAVDALEEHYHSYASNGTFPAW